MFDSYFFRLLLELSVAAPGALPVDAPGRILGGPAWGCPSIGPWGFPFGRPSELSFAQLGGCRSNHLEALLGGRPEAYPELAIRYGNLLTVYSWE